MAAKLFGDKLPRFIPYDLPQDLIKEKGFDPAKWPAEWQKVKMEFRESVKGILHEIYSPEHHQESMSHLTGKNLLITVTMMDFKDFDKIVNEKITINGEVQANTKWAHDVDVEATREKMSRNTFADGKIVQIGIADLDDMMHTYPESNRKQRELVSDVVNNPQMNIVAYATVHLYTADIGIMFKEGKGKPELEMPCAMVGYEFMDLSVINDQFFIGDLFGDADNDIYIRRSDEYAQELLGMKKSNNDQMFNFEGSYYQIVDSIQKHSDELDHIETIKQQKQIYSPDDVVTGEVKSVCNAIFGKWYINGQFGMPGTTLRENSKYSHKDIDVSLAEMKNFLKEE